MARTPSNKPSGRDGRSPAEKSRTAATPIPEHEATPRPWSAPPAAPKHIPENASTASLVRTATAVATPRAAPTRDEIAARAEALWKAGGCQNGRDEQNWLEAERQLRSERGLS
jgi:hypothetical protein